jgi:hypothetical protein
MKLEATTRNRVRLRHVTQVAALLLAIGACAAPPMRWEKPGMSDPTNDEGECRAAAHREATRRLPYGNGPPVFGYPPISMLQWTQAIDNQRYYVEEALMKVCMRERGYQLTRVSG